MPTSLPRRSSPLPVLALLGSLLVACGSVGLGTTTGAAPPADAGPGSPDPGGAQDGSVASDPDPLGTGSPRTCSLAPRVLAGVPGVIDAMKVARDVAYVTSWSTDGARVLTAIDLGRLTATPIAAARELTLVGIDSAWVVWTEGAERRVHVAGPGGTAPRTLDVALHDYQGRYGMPLLGLSASELVWADGTKGFGAYLTLGLSSSASPAPLAPIAHALPGGLRSPEPWSVADGSLFWSDESGVWSAKLPEVAAVRHLAPRGTSAGARHGVAYVRHEVPGAIDVEAIALADGSSRPLGHLDGLDGLSTKCATPGKLSVELAIADDDALYAGVMTDCMDGRFVGSVRRARVGDPHGTELIAFETRATSMGYPIAVDGGCVYWADGASGMVHGLAR